MGNDRKRGCCFGVLSKRFAAMLLIACALVSATLSLCGCYVVEGPSGNDGAPGTVWRSGTSYNEFSDANIGDYFIDTDDYVLYQKSGMGWIVVMENYGRGSADAAVPSITINADGYWCVGGVSTGVMARGEQGVPGAVPEISVVDGYWHVNGASLGIKAEGESGHTPSVTINAEGYWVIDGALTQTKATPSEIAIFGGYWYIDGVSTAVKAEGADGSAWISGSGAPSTDGKVGDFYLDTSSYDIYEKKEGGWVKIGNIKGADGEDGGASAVQIPSYWKSYLDGKIKEINAKSEAYGADADVFIFITDQHLQGSLDNSSLLINYICENTSVNKVVLGGDTVQGSSSDNALLRQYKNSFNDEILLLAVRGNHDVWGNATENSFWDIMNRPLTDKVEMSDELYYLYDNHAQKIRYIFTDSTYASTDGESNLTDTEQLSWMQSKILELESDWTAIVFHHGIWTAGTGSAISINSDGQLLIDAIDAIYDEAACTIAGIYSGHAHRDYLGFSQKGYALVATTLDCSNSGQSRYDIAYPTRTDGTTTEQTFDVVFLNTKTNTFETVRIGAGSNRSFGYNSNVEQSVSGVSIDKTSALTRVNGISVSLRATVEPLNATDKGVSWSIVSGAELGSITAEELDCTFVPGGEVGEVLICVSTNDGGYTAYCRITVAAEASVTNLTGEFSWTPGTVQYSTGNVSSTDTFWVYSNKVDVSAFRTITFTHIQTITQDTSLGYAFYDESGRYISGASNAGVSYAPVEKTLDVPSGAKYFRVMWINTTNKNYEASIHEIGTSFYCYGNP